MIRPEPHLRGDDKKPKDRMKEMPKTPYGVVVVREVVNSTSGMK
jgi:hypothetical protein